MMLPKSKVYWTKRKDKQIHRRYQFLSQNFMLLTAIQLISFTVLEIQNLQVITCQQIFVIETIYLPVSRNQFSINLTSFIIVQILQLYKFGYGLIYTLTQNLITIATFYIFKIYFSSKKSTFAKPQINIEQEINKIFTIPKTKVNEISLSTSSLNQVITTYISVKIRSQEGLDLKLKKINIFKNVTSLLMSMTQSEIEQQEIDFFQINFEEYLGYNQKHFIVIVSLIKYFCDSLCLEVIIIVSQNSGLNRQLTGDFTQGLYFIGFNQLKKMKCNTNDSNALQQSINIILRMEHDLSLSIQDRQRLFRNILDLQPPQFEVIKVSNFVFNDQNINLTKIQPYLTINHIIEYFSYKFLTLEAVQYETKENFTEFEQVLNEIENKIQSLVFNVHYELQSIFVFCKLNEIAKIDTDSSHDTSTERQINNIHVIRNKQFGSFNGSKGDELPNEINQQQNSMQDQFTIINQLFHFVCKNFQYIFHLSTWYKKKLAQNTLFKSALVKARPTCISYFHISFITLFFMLSQYLLLKQFQYENVQSSFLGIHLPLIKVNNICLAMLSFASFLQIITNITPAFSHYKLVNNASNLQTDVVKNLLNVDDSKTLEQPNIRLGKRLICFIYETISLSAIYFMFFSTYSVKIQQHIQHKDNNIIFFSIISNMMFMVSTTLAISFSVLSQPEELVSLTFCTKLFFISLFILTGIYLRITEIILFIFMIAIMLVYYIPQLQNFIIHGRQQQQNFNLLNMKARQIQHRIPPFTTLVYNILASKYVSLNNVIQSNYIIRRATIVNENEDEIAISDHFFDKLCHYSNLLQDKQKRQNSCIVYPQVVFSIFQKPETWSSDDQLDFDDLIAEMPQIYQLPIDCPNAAYFVESDNHQHFHNAIQLVFAFSQGVMKKQRIQSCGITAGSLVIYVLEAGQIYVRSQCIQDAKQILTQYSGLVVDGKLFSKYRELDERFKTELQNRINLSNDQEEIAKLQSMVLNLSAVNYDNGRAVNIQIIK